MSPAIVKCESADETTQGENSALVNLFRTLGGFSVAYFQVPWASKHGSLQTFGCEAAIVTGLFLLIIPALQYNGRYLRVGILCITESLVSRGWLQKQFSV